MSKIAEAVAFAQGLPNVGKGVLTAALALVLVLLLLLLWQRPAPKPAVTGSSPPPAVQATGSVTARQSGHDNSQTNITGNHNATNAQNNNGGVNSAGQSGGQTAALIINNAPPVTEQQKQQALSSLQAQISELADFPNTPLQRGGLTLLEQHVVEKRPIKLYEVLGPYYADTIKSYPNGGAELDVTP